VSRLRPIAAPLWWRPPPAPGSAPPSDHRRRRCGARGPRLAPRRAGRGGPGPPLRARPAGARADIAVPAAAQAPDDRRLVVAVGWGDHALLRGRLAAGQAQPRGRGQDPAIEDRSDQPAPPAGGRRARQGPGPCHPGRACRPPAAPAGTESSPGRRRGAPRSRQVSVCRGVRSLARHAQPRGRPPDRRTMAGGLEGQAPVSSAPTARRTGPGATRPSAGTPPRGGWRSGLPAALGHLANRRMTATAFPGLWPSRIAGTRWPAQAASGAVR